MSADHWGYCPSCNSGDFDDNGGPLKESYDFCVDPDTGILEIEYKCRCQECGFFFKLSEKHNMMEKP